MAAKTVPYRSTTIKWNELPIHPANNAPPMSDAEIAELAEDIKLHGMHEPIIFWLDNREMANGSEGPFPSYLLDGRNRLAALKLLGIDDPEYAPEGGLVVSKTRTLPAIKEKAIFLSLSGGGRDRRSSKIQWETDCDPYAFHQSMNVYRRHLTPEQRRELIAVRLKENPARSNRQIGKVLKADHKTVGTVRKDLEGRGEIPHVDRTIDTKGRQQPTRKPAKAPPPKSAPDTAASEAFLNLIPPHEACCMAVRAMVLDEWLPQIPEDKFAQLVTELRDEVEDIARVVEKRRGRANV